MTTKPEVTTKPPVHAKKVGTLDWQNHRMIESGFCLPFGCAIDGRSDFFTYTNGANFKLSLIA